MGVGKEVDHLELSHEDVSLVFKNIDIPTCPAIVTLAMSEAQRDEPDIRKLAMAIEQDVGMAALTIKLANSPMFRTSQPVSRVSVALARLGIRNVVCVVVAAALRSCMSGVDAKWLESFWSHAALVATAAGLIARKQHGIPPDAAYTFALFHDSAIPLLRKRFDNYCDVIKQAMQNKQPLIDAENEYFPCTHPIVGSLLARNWGLPKNIGQSILFHHESDVYDLPEATLSGLSVSLIAVTHVAEHLVAGLNENANFEVTDEHFQEALHHLGITLEELEEIRELLEHEGSRV
jgi:HD-like signal output (HDOD) protein